MKGIGLVFAGGGGKGAYEIGVWKYLHEIGLDQYVRVVSGTSVGALNAALFVGGTYEVAEDLWLNIEPSTILSPKKIKADDVMRWFASMGVSMSGPLTGALGRASSKVIATMATGIEAVAQSVLIRVRSDHLFSRDGLIAMIDDGVSEVALHNSDIPCYVTCLGLPWLGVERFKVNDYCKEDVIKLLLASSAIPVIFPYEEFNGKKYCDGGLPVVGDNIPVQPVYDTGVENIIVVHLRQDAVIDKEMYPGARILEIVPSVDLGNALTGTLDFTPEGSKRRMQQGYVDVKKALQPLVDMLMVDAENRRLLQYAQQSMDTFVKKKNMLCEEESEIKSGMKTDGFSELISEIAKEK